MIAEKAADMILAV